MITIGIIPKTLKSYFKSIHEHYCCTRLEINLHYVVAGTYFMQSKHCFFAK